MQTSRDGDLNYLIVYWKYLNKVLCLYALRSEILAEVALHLIACLNFKHITSDNRCEFISPTEISYIYRGFKIVHS